MCTWRLLKANHLPHRSSLAGWILLAAEQIIHQGLVIGALELIASTASFAFFWPVSRFFVFWPSSLCMTMFERAADCSCSLLVWTWLSTFNAAVAALFDLLRCVKVRVAHTTVDHAR